MSNGAVPMGVCYSPYHQQGGPGPGYTEADVEADMAIIAKHFHSIRTYTVQFANIYNVRAASKHNLKVCLGAWIFQGDWSRTQSEITTAAEQVFEHPGTVVHFIVGNEVDRPKLNYTPGEVLQAMKYARKTLDGYGPNDIPVTVCFTGYCLATWESLVGDLVRNRERLREASLSYGLSMVRELTAREYRS